MSDLNGALAYEAGRVPRMSLINPEAGKCLQNDKSDERSRKPTSQERSGEMAEVSQEDTIRLQVTQGW